MSDCSFVRSFISFVYSNFGEQVYSAFFDERTGTAWPFRRYHYETDGELDAPGIRIIAHGLQVRSYNLTINVLNNIGSLARGTHAEI